MPGKKTRKALLILNRQSGQHDTSLARIREIFTGQGIEVIAQAPEDLSSIPEYIRNNSSGADMIIVGGGDGTISLSLDALQEANLPVGILPLGTANDLARTLKIPMETESACRVIARQKTKFIDLGAVDGKSFLNVAHLGLGAKIKKYLAQQSKQELGILSYFPSFYQAFQSNYPFTASIACDGKIHQVEAIHISIGNGRHYGGGLTVAEDASIDDHCLDVFTLGPQNLLELGTLAYHIRTGKFDDLERVQQLRGKQVTVETATPKQVTADGEEITKTPCTFEVLANRLEVIVPENLSH